MKRNSIAALLVSASALIGIAVHEGYRDEAYIPVKGDRPTVGFGDATGVKPGDKTTPVRALIRLGAHVSATEKELRACLGDVALHQHEWDAYNSLAYNIGATAFCGSTLARYLRMQPPNYLGACEQILRWDKFQGRALPGLTKRRKEEYALCMGAP